MDSYDSEDGRRGRLDLNAPLISTRHLCGYVAANETRRRAPSRPVYSSGDTSRSVPFLWEAAPGVPKDSDRASYPDELLTPPPKLPPSRWRPQRGDGSGEDDGSDGDADKCSAADTVSMPGSLGVVCSPSRVSRFDGLDSEGDAAEGGSRSPSFIIRRFLPAAEALAAASSVALNIISKDHSNRKVRPRHHRHPEKEVNESSPSRRIDYAVAPGAKTTRSYPSSKACGGPMFFFPWSLKRLALCGFKSRPVQTGRSPHEIVITRAKSNIIGSDGFGQCYSETDVDDGCDDDMQSTRAWQSPGWGLPFLDHCHRWDRSGRHIEERKVTGISLAGKRCDERGSGGRSSGKLVWSLPPLRSPSEPWLTHVLSSTNKRF